MGRSRDSHTNLRQVGVAPEVNQGAWRERVFTPRAVLSREEVKEGLLGELRAALSTVGHLPTISENVRKAWLPLLRQAIEQAGGDGIDAWLRTLFSPPGRTAKQPLFGQVSDSLRRMDAAVDRTSLEQEANRCVKLVDAALSAAPVKLSFKQMERQLEGKLEVDELLGIHAGAQADLNRRFSEIGHAMGQLRDQIRTRPGKQPDGMYTNFVRLKVELSVIDAELKRRAAAL